MVASLILYVVSNPARTDFYDHFVWQAQAFLDGRAAITWPVSEGPFRNDHFQDVMPLDDMPGHGLLPFPPLPAVVLLPFVWLFGLAANGALVATAVGALNVGLCWGVMLRVTRRRAVAALATVFYGFGTVAWYAAMLGSTWFLAHVVASTLVLLAIGAALGAHGNGRGGRGPVRAIRAGLVDRVEWRQLLAGFLLGLGALARLPVILGAPFLALVGGGGSWPRRAAWGWLGAALPVLGLLAYNVATAGAPFHPAYEYLYRVEYRPVPALVNPEWSIEDPRYLPQNSLIMLAWPPETPLASDLGCRQGAAPEGLGLLLDPDCPLLRPDPLGMSLLLSSPAWLLALPGVLHPRRRRLAAAAGLAVLAIALANLMHFSQGWVQFGYRFSNDFAPFALILACLGIARSGVGALSLALVAASVLVNAWGVYWGVTLGW